MDSEVNTVGFYTVVLYSRYCCFLVIQGPTLQYYLGSPRLGRLYSECSGKPLRLLGVTQGLGLGVVFRSSVAENCFCF